MIQKRFKGEGHLLTCHKSPCFLYENVIRNSLCLLLNKNSLLSVKTGASALLLSANTEKSALTQHIPNAWKRTAEPVKYVIPVAFILQISLLRSEHDLL